MERFFSQIEKQEGGCWVWKGYPKIGYGQFRVNGKRYYTHRYSWIIHNGEIKDGLHVLHKCDNPRCVNPDHLFLGTQADNMRDMTEKGRRVKGKDHYLYGKRMCEESRLKISKSIAGEKHPNSKLNVEIVREIRRLYDSGEMKPGKIAEKFGISTSCAEFVAYRRSWRSVL